MYPYIKRVFDVVFSALAGLAAAPFILIIALMVRLSSKGPVMFSQQRAGKDCDIFTVYKFRTMRAELERGGAPLSDMERMTGVGRVLRRLSLDELPQLWNILKGDMSFIGPRPLLVQYIPLYTPRQNRRHEVRPGLSGWAQVNGRNGLGWEERFELDVWYVENISFALDLRIFWKTIVCVALRKGVDSSRENTMPVFEGTAGASK